MKLDGVQRAVCTTGLIAVNIIIFAIFMFLGKSDDVLFMLDYGAMYEPCVIEGNEYYRLVTSMFLHFGIEHLLNNMVMLGALGFNLEPEIGKIRFIVIYFLSGIFGNICSLLWNTARAETVISVGASGAVFGLTGALLGLVVRYKGRMIGRLNKKKILLLAVLSTYIGLTTAGVDNAAHIGGLAGGFILEIILGDVKNKPDPE